MTDQDVKEAVALDARVWLLALREQHGKITPEIVREAARPEDSPAHAYVFNVGVEDAAEEYYLERAHTLIRSVKVAVVARDDEPPRRVRCFHYVTDDDGEMVYEPLEVVVASVSKFDEVRTAALQRLHDAESALADLEVIAPDNTKRGAMTRARSSVKTARDLVSAA